MIGRAGSSLIVVGHDGSGSSVDALVWAARLARLTGARLRLVTCWQLPRPFGYDLGYELLVVGSRGHRELVGMLLGSVSEFCAAHASCPVVVVHEGERAAEWLELGRHDAD
jgi:nucleotide-binding universal stress UspA family protein